MTGQDFKQHLMIKAIKSGNLDNIIQVAEFLGYDNIMAMLKDFKYSRISTKQLKSLDKNIVIIKGRNND